MADKFEERKIFVSNKDTGNRAYDLENSSEDNLSGGVTLEDIDNAMFRTINEMIDAHVRTNQGFEKVITLFGTKERWASIRNNDGIRDSNGRLILPLITIIRTNSQKSGNIFSSGLNNITISKRIHDQTIDTKQRMDYDFIDIQNKNYATRQRALWEFVTFPNANYMDLTYEVSFWTDYIQQNNNIFEQIQNKIGYANEKLHSIYTSNGFYFTVTPDSGKNESNLEEFSDDERIIRYTLQYTVMGYLVDKDKIKKERNIIEVALTNEVDYNLSDDIFEKTLPINRSLFGKF